MEPICIVSGLPRSGTSMMMRMLAAGGMPILADGERSADEDNPLGYFELEKVKKLSEDASWLDGAGGKAVKAVSWHLRDLPGDRRYRVVFLRRDLDEVLASQRVMLERRGEAREGDEGEIKRGFIAHLAEMEEWLGAQPHVQTLYVSYRRAVESPRETAERINRFLGGKLDVDKMAASVEPKLYRRRAGAPAED